MKRRKFPKEKKKKEPIVFDGIIFDSEYEVLFYQWLTEAKQCGYVKRWVYHPDPFVLSEGYKREYDFPMKTKTVTRLEKVFPRIVYTPDFWVYWSEKALEKGLVGSWYHSGKKVSDFPLISQKDGQGNWYSVVDVKPPLKVGGHNASYRDFSIKAPIIWDLYGIMVQEVIPINPVKKKAGEEKVSQVEKCFFSRTWAPKSYLERKKKNGDGFRQIYCLNKSVEDYEMQKMSIQTQY